MPTLDFKGKSHVYGHHLVVPWRPLVPHPDRSVGVGDVDDNLIIHGDNLHALKALLPRYAGRVKCVYIDPPYNTGNEGWVYNDNGNSPALRHWLSENGPVDGEDLERHDKWLTMMWPRLQLLRQLLSDDGVIFVSIDDNEVHHLRMMMDEIFGEENFFVTQVRRAMHTVRNSSKDFNLNADYVVSYAKDKSWFGESTDRYIRYISDKSANYPRDDNDGRGPYKLDPLSARNFFEPYTHTFENGVEWSAPSGSYPRYSGQRLREMEASGAIEFGGTEPRAKRFLRDVQAGQPPNAVLDPDIVRFNATGTTLLQKIFGVGGVFPQPKPVELIQYLVELLRDPEAIVLDSFAGSGTTGHAVLALNKADGGNRRFIMVECEDYADEVTAERIRRVIAGVDGVRDESLREGLGGTFTFCTLGERTSGNGMLSGESLPSFDDLAAWLVHSATGLSIGTEDLATRDENGLIFSDDSRDYYLIYEPDIEWLQTNESVLTAPRAEAIGAMCRERDRSAVVFATARYIPQDELKDMRVMFAQLPFAVQQIDEV